MKKYVLIGENGFFGAKIQEGIIRGAIIEGGINGANTSSTTKVSEYGNLEDIKSIYQNRFYHKLIEAIKRSESNKIYFNTGKVISYDNQSNNSRTKTDKFAIINNTYLWLNSENILQDIDLIGNITNKVNVLGYIIKESTYTSPQIIKTLAMYIE